MTISKGAVVGAGVRVRESIVLDEVILKVRIKPTPVH